MQNKYMQRFKIGRKIIIITKYIILLQSVVNFGYENFKVKQKRGESMYYFLRNKTFVQVSRLHFL